MDDAELDPGWLRRAFQHVDTWVFDLDNTLYPARCGLLAEAGRRMTLFVMEAFYLSEAAAEAMREDLRLRYGTTLSGLMRAHGLQPDEFLSFVHDLDHQPLALAPDLSAVIEALPGRKLIYTNATAEHAERVVRSLGLYHLFEDTVCIRRSQFMPKREQGAYENFVRLTGVEPRRAAMFEDMEANLLQAHGLGFTTVLVREGAPVEHQSTERKPHVDHVTDDLSGFLSSLVPPR